MMRKRLILGAIISLTLVIAGLAIVAITRTVDNDTDLNATITDNSQVINTELQLDPTEDGIDANNAEPISDKASVLTIEEWGIQFDIPDGLTSVEYLIYDDDNVAIYGKPINKDVRYRDDYMAIITDDNSGLVTAKYTLGNLHRSNKSSLLVSHAYPDQRVHGQNIEDSYYYTSWSFSSTATGVGINEIFLDRRCQNLSTPSGDEVCLDQYEAARLAFESINLPNGLLTSIRPIPAPV